MEHKFIRHIVKAKPVVKFIKASRKIILPGFEGLSLYIVSKFFLQGLIKGTINMRATSLAFSFFLALFPSIIFLFTLIPFIPIDNFQDNLLDILKNLMPHSAFEATEDTITDIVKNQRGDLLSVGFFTALYFSTNGFNAMINSFNESYHESETRSVLHQRLVSLLLVIITVVLVCIAIGMIVFSEYSFTLLLDNDSALYYLLLFGKWIILVLLCFTFISFNYYLGPKRKSRWKFFSVGSYFATVLTVISSIGFSYYVNNFGNYNKLYGSIGTLIVVMLWLYINSLILLLGLDLNASIRLAKKQQKAFQNRV